MGPAADQPMLVLFARQPQPGRGKRRIAAELGDSLAHTINNGMYAAAIADLNRWPGPTAIALTGNSDTSATGVDPGNGMGSEHRRLHIQQPEGTFGQRIKTVDRVIRQKHQGPILFIGSDAPELTEAHYQDAADQLRSHDIVLAPASDGGVTLLGARGTWPELEQLPWGTNQLCEALEQGAIAAGLLVARLPLTQDVDTLDDVLRIRSTLQGDTRPNQQTLQQAIADALPEIEVIIPVRDDTESALNLSQQVRAQGVDAVTVADQLGDPKLQQICEHEGIRYLHAESTRGERLDLAARSSRAGIFWFLHADCRPDPNAVTAIRKQLIDSDGGCFTFAFSDGTGTAPRWLESLINWRARHFTPYGDQGIFVRRDTYLASGGFAHEPLFEEVPLIRYLKQEARFRISGLPIQVAVRRWQKDGWLKRTLLNRWLVLRYMAGTSPEALARSYTRQ